MIRAIGARFAAHARAHLANKLSDAAMLELFIMEMFPAIFQEVKMLKNFYRQKIDRRNNKELSWQQDGICSVYIKHDGAQVVS